MISFALKCKKLKILAVPFLKSEVFKPETVFQRTVCTSNVLFLRSIYKKELNEQDFPFSSKNQSNLGKIVELSDNFDELKIKKRQKEEKKEKLDADENKKSIENVHKNEKQKIMNQFSGFKKQDASKSRMANYKENCNTFRSIMTDLKSKKRREKNQEIILEGKRLIQDAISAGCKPQIVFYSRTEDLGRLQLPDNVKVIKVSYKSMSLWTDVVSSQGVIGIFQMPKASTFKSIPEFLPLTVICDNVRDPGNLGSILRVAAGVGIKKMILTKGCVDLWEPKVLRAGAGAHFRLPVISNILWSAMDKEISENSKVLLADSFNHNECDESSKNEKGLEYNFRKCEFSANLPIQCYYSLQYKNENTVLIIGGETHGISDEAYKFALGHTSTRVFIPMHNKVESLNNSVALGILIYEIKRQLDLMCVGENQLNAARGDL